MGEEEGLEGYIKNGEYERMTWFDGLRHEYDFPLTLKNSDINVTFKCFYIPR